MPPRPRMQNPNREMAPQELVAAIEEWAARHGYMTTFRPSGKEYGRVVVQDPAGGSTFADVPNAHHGRRLRKDQVRYVVRDINGHWQR
jgi:hypothetical protein